MADSRFFFAEKKLTRKKLKEELKEKKKGTHANILNAGKRKAADLLLGVKDEVIC